jgi:polyisoprenoid-binding protein YceI
MRALTMLGVTTLMATSAFAKTWDIDAQKSSLRFTAEQAGEKFSGKFPNVKAHVTFDPENAGDADIRIEIPVASIQVEGEDRQEEITGSDWFDAKQFATASFVATQTAKQPDGSFVANGTLTIRGVSKPLELPFTLREESGFTIAEGSITINRRDYGVGQGSDWETDEWVAFPVSVQFTLYTK